MARELARSVDELLTPARLGAVEGRSIAAVRQLPFHSADSLSGSRFLAVVTEGEGGERRYVLKRISREWDWIMRATGDDRGRAVVAWTSGLLNRLPHETTSEVVACALDGDGWAVLLCDIGEFLIPTGDAPISADEHARFLQAMAALHAEFWGQAGLADPALGFCSLTQRYSEFTPAVSLAEAGGSAPIPPVIGQGWDAALRLLEPRVATGIERLLDDPKLLEAALGRFPQTVVHGDWKLGNLGLKPGVNGEWGAILLDWAVVGPAPPAVDLAWYLAVNCDRIPTSKEATIGRYRELLSGRLNETLDAWWEPQLGLALLGGFVQLGWAKSLGIGSEDKETAERARAEFDWWAERLPSGLALL